MQFSLKFSCIWCSATYSYETVSAYAAQSILAVHGKWLFLRICAD